MGHSGESVGCLFLLHLLAGIRYRRTFPFPLFSFSKKKSMWIQRLFLYFLILSLFFLIIRLPQIQPVGCLSKSAPVFSWHDLISLYKYFVVQEDVPGLYFPCPSTEVSHLSIELWFLLVESGIQNSQSGLLALGVVTVIQLFTAILQNRFTRMRKPMEWNSIFNVWAFNLEILLKIFKIALIVC